MIMCGTRETTQFKLFTSLQINVMENLIENNKLIAYFMVNPDSVLFTSPSYANGKHWISQKFQSIEDPDGNDLLTGGQMKFHTDWNWLIPVVEKIYSIDIYYSHYISENASMFYDGKIQLTTNIKEVYEQCIDFIKWYNKQNSPA